MAQRTYDPPQAISPAGAALALGCSRTTIDRMIGDQVLTAARYGRRVFVSTDSISSFLTGDGR